MGASKSLSRNKALHPLDVLLSYLITATEVSIKHQLQIQNVLEWKRCE